MARSEKFLFDLDFDAPPMPRSAFVTEQEEAPPAPAFSEEQLADARLEGLRAGLQQGREEATALLEQSCADALTGIGGALETLLRTVDRRADETERASVRAAIEILKKLFPSLSERQALRDIEAVIAKCLHQLRDEPRVVVRIGDQLLDPIKARIGELAGSLGFEGRIVLLAEPEFQVGDVRVEWADGGAERSSSRLWAGIDALLARTFAATPPSPDAAARKPAAPDRELPPRATPSGAMP